MRILHIEVPKGDNDKQRSLRLIEQPNGDVEFVRTVWTAPGCSYDDTVCVVPQNRRELLAKFLSP